MISDETDTTYGAKRVGRDGSNELERDSPGPGLDFGEQQPGPGRYRETARGVGRISGRRYGLRPRQNGKVVKDVHKSVVVSSYYKGRNNFDCKVQLCPIVPVDKMNSFNCSVNLRKVSAGVGEFGCGCRADEKVGRGDYSVDNGLSDKVDRCDGRDVETDVVDDGREKGIGCVDKEVRDGCGYRLRSKDKGKIDEGDICTDYSNGAEVDVVDKKGRERDKGCVSHEDRGISRRCGIQKAVTRNLRSQLQEVLINDVGVEGNRVGGLFTDVVDLQNSCGDGVDQNIMKCGSKYGRNGGCSIRERFIPTSYIVSTNTHRLYKINNFDLPNTCSCYTSNLIYLITCSTCCLQYVGETAQQLKRRINDHTKCMRSFEIGKNSTHLYRHFAVGRCKGSSFVVQVIENWAGDGRRANGTIDKDLTRKRRKRETEWMHTLRTVYPYGLNDREFNETSIKDGNEIIGKRFNRMPRTFNRVVNASRHCHNNEDRNYSYKTFLDKFSNCLLSDLKNVGNFIRVSLASMTKKNLRIVATHLRELMEDQSDTFVVKQWCLMGLDIIESKLYIPPPVKLKRTPPQFRLPLCFTSKAFDFINLPKILRSPQCNQSKPELLNDKDIPMVVYKLTQPIRSKVLNYNKFVKHLDLDAYNADMNTVPCHCHEFDQVYLDANHGHILTGNLNIISNHKLRELIAKGPKYREPTTIDFEDARAQIVTAMDSYVEIVASKKKVDKSFLLDWKDKVLSEVDRRIDKIKVNFIPREVNTVLTDNQVLKNLNFLHDKFVFVPIDKATNNIAIICKRLYASVIHKELNFSSINSSSNNTYEQVDILPEDIINRHKMYLKSHGCELQEDMEKLPCMYWSPKVHKTPVGTRFIIASKRSSLKPLSKDVASIFKLIFDCVRRYYNKASYFSGLHQFWIAENNAEVVSAMTRISKKSNAKCVSTYDFSTLYTMIPHDKLIEVLYSIVDFVFNDGDRSFISVTENGANWVKGKRSVAKLFTKDKVKEILSYLITNSYFQVGGALFRQVIGIPIGSDPAPFLANLFLFHYESKWIRNTKNSEYGRTRKFGNVFRFLDDLIAINDGGEFNKSFSEIYPPELSLKKESISDQHATFLDLNITISNNTFHHKLFDKRDAYSFSIVRFPFKCSNMPRKMFYSTIGAEMLRICRATSQYNEFLVSSATFGKRMVKQGAINNSIRGVLNKMINRHGQEFNKFGCSSEQLVNDLLLTTD